MQTLTGLVRGLLQRSVSRSSRWRQTSFSRMWNFRVGFFSYHSLKTRGSSLFCLIEIGKMEGNLFLELFIIIGHKIHDMLKLPSPEKGSGFISPPTSAGWEGRVKCKPADGLTRCNSDGCLGSCTLLHHVNRENERLGGLCYPGLWLTLSACNHHLMVSSF